MRNILYGLSALIVSSCAEVGATLANLPASWDGDIAVYKDITFDVQTGQKLDVYIPKTEDKRPMPVAVFFYGGRWSDGSKDTYPFVAKAFADKGYATVIADYRQYPDVKFPAFVDDGAKAIAWTHDKIANYGGDSGNIFVAGHSSGAHIGALVAADERYLKKIGKDTSIIKAFAGLAGPYDFVPQEEDLKDMFGPPEQYPQMTVTTFIDGSEPPFLLLWGQDDKAVWERNIKLLSDKIKEKNGQVETKIYPNVGHVEIIAKLTWFINGDPDVLADVTNFFNKHKKGAVK